MASGWRVWLEKETAGLGVGAGVPGFDIARSTHKTYDIKQINKIDYFRFYSGPVIAYMYYIDTHRKKHKIYVYCK
jgi:hypothetical protein